MRSIQLFTRYPALHESENASWSSSVLVLLVLLVLFTPTAGTTATYEVWAGNTDLSGGFPDTYYNIDQQGYVKLGEAEGSQTFSGQYAYYVIATRSPVEIDAFEGSDGTFCCPGSWWGGNVVPDPQFDPSLEGAPDGQYAVVGFDDSGRTYWGFIAIENVGLAWSGITVYAPHQCNGGMSMFTVGGATAGTDNSQSIFVGFESPSGSYSTASLSGEYWYVRFMHDGDASEHKTETGTITFDGSGSYTRAYLKNTDGTVISDSRTNSYAVDPDGALTISTTGAAFEGSLNSDASMFTVGGATAGTDNSQSIFVGFESPSGSYSTASLSGEYWYVRFMHDGDASEHKTETGTITFDGSGSYTRAYLKNTDGTVISDSRTNSYAVDPDGALTISTTGAAFEGSLNSDASMFTVGGATAGTDNSQSIFVGFESPSGSYSTASLSGEYWYVRFMHDGDASEHKTETGTITFDGSGSYTRAYLKNTDGTVISDSRTNSYGVDPDEVLTISTTGAAFQGNVNPITPTPGLGEISVKIQLKFNKPSKDKIQVKVKNWTLPAGVTPTDVTVNVGGAAFTGTLDAKGNFKSLDGRDSIKMKQSRKTQLWRVTVKRKNNDFAAYLADEGCTDADNPKPGLPVTVPLTIEVGGATHSQDVSLVYTSKLGKKGTAK